MLKKFYTIFTKLPESNKSMIYLSWIYNIGVLVGPLFINIYVYNINGSVLDSLIYNAIFFTFSFLSFTLIGYVMSVYQKNVAKLYYPAYVCFILSFFFPFIFDGSIIGAYIMAGFYAFGNGLFWCALHSQELKSIKDSHRDFYSSSIGVGKTILSIIVPIILTVCLYVGTRFGYDGFLNLFFLLALVYCLSFFFIKNISSYIPNKFASGDVKNFFNLRKYKYGHLYFFFDGLKLVFTTITLAIASITLFKNELDIGIFQTVLAFISVFLVAQLGLKSKNENRLFYHRIIVGILSCSLLGFLIHFSLTGIIVFSLIGIIIEPLFRVSHHVYNLKLMDSVKQGSSDFYPSMILREIILWIGRIAGLSILLMFYYYCSLEQFLKLGLLFSALSYLAMHISITFWEKYEK